MEEILLTLNQPIILSLLFGGAILAVLIDYLFPVDWLAYVGYLLFAVFVGATIPATPALSLMVIGAVIIAMLLLHRYVFAKYLTNAPRYERPTSLDDETVVNG